ncbi:MAG: b-glycosidase [Chloroflexota bacterium]|nr:b-glycosidase [Chloroflexota bacterium]
MAGEVDERGIFPTFFLSGFECSTFVWKDRGRRDLVAETRHREHAVEDYRLLADVGIGVAREAVPWPLVERDGRYDFGILDPVIEAMNAARVAPIWDLCHYGYPDDLDPFAPDFAERFAAYCRAAARHVADRVTTAHGPYFSPMNEITYFSQAGGLWGLVAPFGRDRETFTALRLALCRAAIAGINAIRAELPGARMIAMDPVVNIVAPRDRPDLVDQARPETWDDTYVAWDVLAGLRHPELGGSPEILDVVGVNCYSFGQQELRGDGPHASLPPDDDRIIPLSELIAFAWQRYRRPMIIAETSGLRDGRSEWLDDVMQESLAAVRHGIDLQGVCLFPAVDMPDWNNGEWLHNGIADLVEDGPDLRREPDAAYIGRLRHWQRFFNEAERLDEGVISAPVDIGDVRDAARQHAVEGDRDWS